MSDDFPQFDVPSSVPASAPAASAPTSPEPTATPAAQPEPQVEVAPPSDPLWAPLSAQREAEAAAATPEPAPAPVATPEPEAETPQPSALEQAVLAQGRVLAALAERLAPQPEPAAAPTPRDPKSLAIEAALIKHVPQLAPLIAALNDPTKAAALEQILASAPQHQQQVSQFYADYAEQTVGKLTEGYATAYGLDAATLKPAERAEIENDLSDAFQTWITRPGNAKLLQRYEMGDIKVVDAFNQHFAQRFVAPAKRQGQATIAARGASVAGLPRGGGSSIPTPQQTAPVVQRSGETDVFAEAWDELAGKRAAG